MPPKTERLELRIDTELLEQVDAWRSAQPDLPTRAEAIRRLIDKGLTPEPSHQISITDGERLMISMLCEVMKHLDVRDEIDPEFVQKVLMGGHDWALRWQLPGLMHGQVDSERVLYETLAIMDMWWFIETGYEALSKKERDRVAKEAEPFGKFVRFEGFDGNTEGEYVSVAAFLVKEMNRFSDFKGRTFNSHTTSITRYRRMLPVFESLRSSLVGRQLNGSEIIAILKPKGAVGE